MVGTNFWGFPVSLGTKFQPLWVWRDLWELRLGFRVRFRHSAVVRVKVHKNKRVCVFVMIFFTCSCFVCLFFKVILCDLLSQHLQKGGRVLYDTLSLLWAKTQKCTQHQSPAQKIKTQLKPATAAVNFYSRVIAVSFRKKSTASSHTA